MFAPVLLTFWLQLGRAFPLRISRNQPLITPDYQASRAFSGAPKQEFHISTLSDGDAKGRSAVKIARARVIERRANRALADDFLNLIQCVVLTLHRQERRCLGEID